MKISENEIIWFSTSLLADYFVAWYAEVDPEDRVFVARLSDVFGYTIPLEVN